VIASNSGGYGTARSDVPSKSPRPTANLVVPAFWSARLRSGNIVFVRLADERVGGPNEYAVRRTLAERTRIAQELHDTLLQDS